MHLSPLRDISVEDNYCVSGFEWHDDANMRLGELITFLQLFQLCCLVCNGVLHIHEMTLEHEIDSSICYSIHVNVVWVDNQGKCKCICNSPMRQLVIMYGSTCHLRVVNPNCIKQDLYNIIQ